MSECLVMILVKQSPMEKDDWIESKMGLMDKAWFLFVEKMKIEGTWSKRKEKKNKKETLSYEICLFIKI